MTRMTMTAHDAVRALKEVVAQAPEGFIYTKPEGRNTCVYEHNGEGSCGVGKALLVLGVTIAELQVLDRATPAGNPISACYLHAHLSDIYFEREAEWVFDAFQDAQDRNSAWGYALTRATSRYELYYPNSEVSE